MNISIVNNIEKTLDFLREIINQLKNYNSIEVNNLKLLCHIVYKQYTIEEQKEIQFPLFTALGLITENTRVYTNNKIELQTADDIYDSYINTNFKLTFGDIQ